MCVFVKQCYIYIVNWLKNVKKSEGVVPSSLLVHQKLRLSVNFSRASCYLHSDFKAYCVVISICVVVVAFAFYIIAVSSCVCKTAYCAVMADSSCCVECVCHCFVAYSCCCVVFACCV